MVVQHCSYRSLRRSLTAIVLALIIVSSKAAAGELLSYANGVKEATGISESAALVALGPPDYLYTEGTFNAGASVVFTFLAPLDDVPDLDDLVLSIFVTGQGTESTTVRVEARAAETDPFVEVGTIRTADARLKSGNNPFAPFDHVHQFGIAFAERVRRVSEVRVTNVGGDDLKLDALEGIHPAIKTPTHAVEMRIFRLRDDFSKRLALRFKNLGSLQDGVPMAGFVIQHATGEWIDETIFPIVALREVIGCCGGDESEGRFVDTPATSAGPDNGPRTQFTEYVWSGPGAGLDPGGVASHQRWNTIDTDLPDEEFLENMTFTIWFADGVSLSAGWQEIVGTDVFGELYALYQYPPAPVTVNGPRPTFYYEFFDGDPIPEDTCTDCYVAPAASSGSVGRAPLGALPCGVGAASFTGLSLASLMLIRRRRRGFGGHIRTDDDS